MLEPGERIFGLEHATSKASSVSHLNDPTNFAFNQLYKDIKILPTESLNLKYGFNSSVLQVLNGHLTPREIHMPQKGNEATVIRQIESINNLEYVYEPTGRRNGPASYTIPNDVIKSNDEGTRICVQNKELEPISVILNFEDVVSTPAWNGEPMNFIYAHICVDLWPDYYVGLDITQQNYGGGMFINLFNDNPANTWDRWMPLIGSTQISSRTVAIPLTYTQEHCRIMIRGCRNWSIEFLAYITGI